MGGGVSAGPGSAGIWANVGLLLLLLLLGEEGNSDQ